MKIRGGFVSNPSSSSFVISKDNLSKRQIKMIHLHLHKARRHRHEFGFLRDEDEWTITEEGDEIRGSTWMDNFDMRHYLKEYVKVADEHIMWDI